METKIRGVLDTPLTRSMTTPRYVPAADFVASLAITVLRHSCFEIRIEKLNA
jgi:hypothetical protein